MATITERGADGSIIYKAASTLTVPSLDILSTLFESKHAESTEDMVLHADAEDSSKAVTKAQARNLLKRTAQTFRSRYGVGAKGPGKDVVLVFASNHFMLPNLFYASLAADGIYSASSPASTPAELAGQIEQISAKLVVCTADIAPTAIAAAKLAKLPPMRVLVLGDGHEFQLREALSGKVIPPARSMLEWTRIEDDKVLADRTACILFSSGTTGKPKGVHITHRNIVAEAALNIDPAREWNKANKPHFRFRTLAHLPVAHIAGAQGYFINPAYYGGVTFWMPRFDFAKFLEHNKKLGITSFFSVPPIYLLMSKMPIVTDQFDSIDNAISGAAPLGKDTQRAAEKKLGKGQAQLTQVWGLTETTGSICNLPRDATDDTGSVGALIANSEARIVDDDGKDVEPGQDGEIWVKSPVVFKGYHENEAATRETFKDGWFCTGDIGHFDKGLLYITDRKKELIKYKAHQVAPAELEGLLITNPKIFDAAVIGVPGEGTEVPRAYVVADPKQISAQEIADWVAGQVSHYKRLRGGVIFLEAIPKSPSGKILRKDLRDAAKKEQRTSKI